MFCLAAVAIWILSGICAILWLLYELRNAPIADEDGGDYWPPIK